MRVEACTALAFCLPTPPGGGGVGLAWQGPPTYTPHSLEQRDAAGNSREPSWRVGASSHLLSLLSFLPPLLSLARHNDVLLERNVRSNAPRRIRCPPRSHTAIQRRDDPSHQGPGMASPPRCGPRSSSLRCLSTHFYPAAREQQRQFRSGSAQRPYCPAGAGSTCHQLQGGEQ